MTSDGKKKIENKTSDLYVLGQFFDFGSLTFKSEVACTSTVLDSCSDISPCTILTQT